VIIGLGTTTPVGLGSPQTAASVRAGITRFTKSAWLDRQEDPLVVAAVPEDALPELAPGLEALGELTYREARMIRLAQLALEDALEPLGQGGPQPPLLLGLPDWETQIPLRIDRLPAWLDQQCGQRLDVAASRCVARGRAAGLLALQEAIKLLEAGTAPCVLAGGVDSHIDLHVLGTLDRAGRVKSAANLDGFVPGEAAGFLLLAKAQAARHKKRPVIARLAGLKTGFEEGHLGSDQPYKGEGLARTLTELFDEAGQGLPAADVYASMNGEYYWAREWGVAFLRNAKSIDPEFRIHHPADCFGDPGAGFGPVLVALAALDLRRRPEGSRSLVYGSSDLGDRAAVLLQHPAQPEG
jgi:3-oxoacyl-[acyl-carrier-protein] synthase-1